MTEQDTNHDNWLSTEAAGLAERRSMLEAALATDRASIKALQANVRGNLHELEIVKRLLRATEPRQRKRLPIDQLSIFADDAP